MTNLGDAIRKLWESKIGYRIKCASCNAYLDSLNTLTDIDTVVLVAELDENLPLPKSLRARLKTKDRQALIAETIASVVTIPSPMEAKTQRQKREYLIRDPSGNLHRRRGFHSNQSITVVPTVIDRDRFSGKCVAITSISPNPERIERQLVCLNSWRDIGLPVIAVNTAAETQELYHEFSSLVTWSNHEIVGTEYDKPTQRVSTLIDVGRRSGLPFLLINSDIEIQGDAALITDAMNQPDKLTIGVRYNHNDGKHVSESRIEPSGLDVFLMTPKMAATIPDLPFGIGRPVWDYWLPHHFRSLGFEFNWIKQPFFFHESHQLGWTQEEWALGAKWMQDHYGLELVHGSSAYRRNL